MTIPATNRVFIAEISSTSAGPSKTKLTPDRSSMDARPVRSFKVPGISSDPGVVGKSLSQAASSHD